MVSSVANNTPSSPAVSRTFQPGGTETQRQTKETNDQQSRAAEASESQKPQSLVRSREETREPPSRADLDDGGSSRQRQSRGNVVDVTV